MTKIAVLLQIINSMNKSEKRYFKLSSELQIGTKSYVFLYKCLEKNIPIEDVSKLFIEKYGEKSLEPTSNYLYQQLLKCLSKTQSHDFYQTAIFNYISNASLLYERSFLDESLAELAKAKELAKKYENDILTILILRTELIYLSEKDFPNTTEKEIATTLMKINKRTKSIQDSNMHLSLYTTLQKRVHQFGDIRTPEQKDMMNDLVLCELNLIANSNYSGSQSTRLHLLFQASYYLSTGNYKSALRFYYELVNLYNEHPRLAQSPPIYYFKTLEGIVNTLVAMNLYDELHNFLDKLQELENGNYPKDFILRVRFCIFSIKAKSALNQNRYSDAFFLLEVYEEPLVKQAKLLNMETQLCLYLLIVSILIWNGDYYNARKQLRKINQAENNFHILPQFRICRLMNLLVNAEMGEYDFLENEIRSIKRDIQKNSHLNLSEKIIIKYVLSCPIPKSKIIRQKAWLKIKKEIDKVHLNKLEVQYQNAFNFMYWIEKRLNF